jgi:hypothetical protein
MDKDGKKTTSSQWWELAGGSILAYLGFYVGILGCISMFSGNPALGWGLLIVSLLMSYGANKCFNAAVGKSNLMSATNSLYDIGQILTMPSPILTVCTIAAIMLEQAVICAVILADDSLDND